MPSLKGESEYFAFCRPLLTIMVTIVTVCVCERERAPSACFPSFENACQPLCKHTVHAALCHRMGLYVPPVCSVQRYIVIYCWVDQCSVTPKGLSIVRVQNPAGTVHTYKDAWISSMQAIPKSSAPFTCRICICVLRRTFCFSTWTVSWFLLGPVNW